MDAVLGRVHLCSYPLPHQSNAPDNYLHEYYTRKYTRLLIVRPGSHVTSGHSYHNAAKILERGISLGRIAWLTKLELVNVDKSYGNKRVLNKVSLEVEKGEFFVILGPSGEGKAPSSGSLRASKGRILAKSS